MRPARDLFFTATALLLAALCLLQLMSLWRAPAVFYPAAVRLTLAPGATVRLGQQELAAPQADRSHIAVRRDRDGRWWVRNLSPTKQVLLQRADGERRMGSAPLAAAQAFQVGASRFTINHSAPGQVSFTGAGQRWAYDGALLYRAGHVLPPCPDSGLASRAVLWWNRAMPALLQAARPLSFGGNLYCGNRLGLAGVPSGAAMLVRAGGQLLLAAGATDGDRAAPALLLATASGDTDLRATEQPLAGVRALIVGHTRLLLTDGAGRTDDQLTLLPTRRVSLYTDIGGSINGGPLSGPNASATTAQPALAWQWQQRTLWQSPVDAPLWAGLALMLLALAASLVLPQNSPWRPRAAVMAAATLLLCGASVVVLQRAGHVPSAALSLALGSAALALWLLLPGRLVLATAAGLLLLALGLLMQLELGLGGMESSWLRYYQKSTALLAAGAGVAGLWRLWSRPGRAVPQQRTVEWLLAVFAAVALLALVAEVLWGDETGVFDLQPVELGKMALTVLTAHCLAVRLSWLSGPRQLPGHSARWLRLIGPALLFMALMGTALVQVDDFSPLILMLVWCGVMLLTYALTVRHTLLALAVAALVLALIAALAWLRTSVAGADAATGAGVGAAAPWPLNGGFYADRFLVWLDPASHPHTGQQLLLGARAIGDGGWWGSDGLIGLTSLGQPAGAVLRIPAVQDDFAPSFFMYRHGLVGALLLWALQAALLTGLAQVVLASHAAAGAARHFGHAWLARFRCFALCGGAGFVLGHLLLSWGTNLAIFPIMGQPMSFLSAGGSHLLFFLCPLLAICAISALSTEENVPCRSMSSTRS